MRVKVIVLFLMVCGLAGIFIFLGSVLGNAAGKTGLYAGAIIGGIAGVALALWLSIRFKLLTGQEFGLTFTGGVIGLIVASIIAVKNLDGPLIPVASVAIIGLGALAGKFFSNRRPA